MDLRFNQREGTPKPIEPRANAAGTVVVGGSYDAVVTEVSDIVGAQLEIRPGQIALLHRSQWTGNAAPPGSTLVVGDVVRVRVIGRNKDGAFESTMIGRQVPAVGMHSADVAAGRHGREGATQTIVRAYWPGAHREPVYLRRAGALIVALALLIAVTLWLSLEPRALGLFVSEDGAIEQGTVFLYGVALIALWIIPNGTIDLRSIAALSVLLLAFAARELDLHKYWTASSMLKVSYYLGVAPTTHKLIGLTVIALVGMAVLHLARKGAAWVVAGLRSGDSRAQTVVLFIAVLVVSKVFDRSASILVEDFDVSLQLSTIVLVRSIEEFLELALPLLVVVGLLQHRHAMQADGGRILRTR